MRYPGTAPYGGGMSNFGGANALTNQLSPNSLQHRRQQLINTMVTGSDRRRRPTGAGIGGALGDHGAINPFLAMLMGHQQDDGGQFYGGGAPTPATPPPVSPSSAAPAPTAPSATSDPSASVDPLTAIQSATSGSGVSGYNPLSAATLSSIMAALAAATASGPGSGTYGTHFNSGY